MKNRFLRQMHRFILQHTMIEAGDTVVVAVSGGADSLALLYGLHALHTQLNYCQLHVVHLNHGLRPDAVTDAEFVEQHAARLGLPFHVHTVDVPRLRKQWKLSVEAAGRRARYEFYETVCGEVGATKVALGHHQDDTAETVLMNLLRGAGTTGLKGIAPVRDGKFIRPLMGFTRQELEAFLTSMSLKPRHDLTNTDNRYLRNRIRHELIPLLERNYNPNIKTGLSRTAEVLSAESEYLETAAREAFEVCRITDTQSTGVVLDREKFLQHHIALQRRMLRDSFATILGQGTDFYFDHCQAVLNLIKTDKPNVALSLPNGLQFRRAYQHLFFERAPSEIGDFAYSLVVPSKTFIPILNAELTVDIGNMPPSNGIPLPDGRYQAMFDWDAVQYPLTIRNRRQGDRVQPHGMEGTKKVKDFFIDAKVPRPARDSIPMLVCGDEILWIIGYITSERFKIKPETRRYLYLDYAKHGTFP